LPRATTLLFGQSPPPFSQYTATNRDNRGDRCVEQEQRRRHRREKEHVGGRHLQVKQREGKGGTAVERKSPLIYK